MNLSKQVFNNQSLLSEVIFEYVIDNRQHNGFYWEDFIFIVSNLIKEVNKEDFNDFLVSEFSNRYDLLYIVNKINRYMKLSIFLNSCIKFNTFMI